MIVNTYQILFGPDKETLFEAFKSKTTISFIIALPNTGPITAIDDITISGLQYEDSSGENFNLRGYGCYCLDDPDLPFGGNRPYKLKAYYNTKEGEGFVTVVE